MNPENMQIAHHGVSVLLAFTEGEWLVLTRPTSTHWLSLDSFDPGITPESTREEAIESVKTRLIGAPPPNNHENSSSYCCGKCGKRGIRLWREYQTFLEQQTLTCATCLEAERGKPIDPDRCDSVGWRVAAVPTPDGSSYWGFTSVPMAAVHWWRSLPLR